jgi:hypothetical protein
MFHLMADEIWRVNNRGNNYTLHPTSPALIKVNGNETLYPVWFIYFLKDFRFNHEVQENNFNI